MSKTANPVTVGAFALGAIVLAMLLVTFFNGGNLWNRREHYVLIYDRSIKGLNVGAPVTIKGVKIGEVTDITARMTGDSLSVFNSVVIAIDPNALEREGDTSDKEMMDEMIGRGLRAQLRLQSLLTALLYVDVDFHPDTPATLVNIKTRYKQIPTIPTDLERLTRNLESIDIGRLGENLQEIVNGVNQLINDRTLQNLGTEVSATLASVRAAADQINRQSEQLGSQLTPLAHQGNRTLDDLNRTLPQLVTTLEATLLTLQQTAQTLQQTANNTTYLTSDDSPLLYRLENTAASVNTAAEQLRRLTELLERQPEALIYGRSEEH